MASEFERVSQAASRRLPRRSQSPWAARRRARPSPCGNPCRHRRVRPHIRPSPRSGRSRPSRGKGPCAIRASPR
ncbi:hypothetical protein FPZ54_12295 [Sphingomonas suaedae]|uniref:Uncharacterized protein n=1 Tax=Sphingomonas suaedae TaxID=2599297 RepID=A0A518RLD8_9SPHN|nr:hypothetical protein FPZ54_12295 [Sphingomonas suaedae]